MHPASSHGKTDRRELTTVDFVLFDAVGTLIYPHPSPAEVYHEFGHRHGRDLSLDEVRLRFSAAFHKYHVSGPTQESIEYQRWQRVIADVFDTPLESDLFLALWEHFSRPQSWKVFDDVAAAFDELRRRHVPFGIASNFDARLIRLCAELPPLNGVGRIFHSSAVGWAKPQLEFFTFVQQQLDIEPARILLVGDDEVKDLGGALTASWQAILVDRSTDRRDKQTINNLMNVLEFLA